MESICRQQALIEQSSTDVFNRNEKKTFTNFSKISASMAKIVAQSAPALIK